MGPTMMSGFRTVRSKVGEWDSRNAHAACSASFLDALYARMTSWELMACSVVTWGDGLVRGGDF